MKPWERNCHLSEGPPLLISVELHFPIVLNLKAFWTWLLQKKRKKGKWLKYKNMEQNNPKFYKKFTGECFVTLKQI